MLNKRLANYISSTAFRIYRNLFAFSNYNVREVRGDYLYVIEDRAKQLQFLREVQTQDGRRGIIMKIQQPASTYVAMYQPIPPQRQTDFKISKKSIPWQHSIEQVKSSILNGAKSSIINVNGKSIYSAKSSHQKSALQISRRKLSSLNPVLDVCYELQYGEMFNFTGCLGSRKTSTLSKIYNNYNKYQKHLSLYFNPTSFSQAQRTLEDTHSWTFNNGSMSTQKQTDVGVYMLAVKTIHLAKILSKQGWNVLLGIDNFNSLLQAQWHMLQLLTDVSKRKSSQFINISAPKIAPISIINEIYANCNDYESNKIKKGSGSLTSIIISENNNKTDDQTPQITPYTNNIKHLSSLVQTVQFPLAIKYNYKTNTNPDSKSSFESSIKAVRNHLNHYVREKQESELKRKLYKSDMRDAPWDYYNILDCQWWLQGLQTFKPCSQAQFAQFLQWILINIDNQYVSHWKIKCNDAFTHYSNFISKHPEVQVSEPLQNFIKWAKLEGYFSSFKRDYLK